MYRWIKERLTFRVALGAAGTSLVLCVLCGLISFIILPNNNLTEGIEVAAVTLIPYPTSTVTLAPSPVVNEPTQSSSNAGFSIGKMVRIASSADGGLNLRSAPGVNNSAIYLALEGETYLIMDGPVSADGYTWWNIAASLDPTLNGWAAGDFLEITTTP